MHGEIVPFRAGDGLPLKLGHFRGDAEPTRGPVLVVAGTGVRGAIFSSAPQPITMVDALVREGYDVWVEDWRASIDFPPLRYTLDQAAVFDHPAAVREIRERTGAESIKALVHCQGSTSFTMSSLAGLVDDVRTVVSNAVSLHPVVTRRSRAKLSLLTPVASRIYDGTDPQWAVRPPTPTRKALARWVRLTRHDCDEPACVMSQYIYGAGSDVLWRHANLDSATHHWVAREFGYVPFSFFRQILASVKAGHLVPADDLPALPRSFVDATPPQEQLWTFVGGERNVCFMPEGQERSQRVVPRAQPAGPRFRGVPGLQPPRRVLRARRLEGHVPAHPRRAGARARSVRLNTRSRRGHAQGGDDPPLNQHAGTFVFADLAGYTALTARWGDELAAQVAIALRDAAGRLAGEHRGQLVKSMGDSVLLAHGGPRRRRPPRHRHRAGRSGAPGAGRHPRRPRRRVEGDWFGLAVNLASRLSAQAAPGEVLVSEPTWAAAGMTGCGAPAHAVALGPWVLGDAPDPSRSWPCDAVRAGVMSTPMAQHAPMARAGLTGVVVFSEQRLVAEGLQALLRTAGGFTVPAVTGSLGDLLVAVDRLRPAAVLLDAGAGGPQGARVVLALRPVRPDVRIVVLADSLEPRLAGLVGAGHADALLPKVRGEREGHRPGHPRRPLRPPGAVGLELPHALPARMPGRGGSRPGSARSCGSSSRATRTPRSPRSWSISVNTVKFHVRSIFRELGIRSRVDAARRHGGLAVGVSAP